MKCLILLVVLSVPLSAQSHSKTESNSPDYSLLISIAKCEDVPCVAKFRKKATDKLSRIVLYGRWMMLNAHASIAANGLLTNLPQSNEELNLLMTLPDWHEGATSDFTEMESLSKVYEAWPRLIAGAAKSQPQHLPAYIRYGLLAVNDIHSDYTGYEQHVCRASHNRFLVAFKSLAPSDQAYLRKYVFNPETCRAVFVSEAVE